MQRTLVLGFGVFAYLMSVAVVLYGIAFVAGVGVPRTLDGPIASGPWEAVLVDGLLVCVFGLQHSVMARGWFKNAITRWIPGPAERSLYVLMSNLALALVFWQWRPLPGVVWDLEQPLARGVLWTANLSGWLLILATSFWINHFDLFGLRQVWLHFRGREYVDLGFSTPGPYRIVRHPLYVGWLMAFWSTPTMSVAHLVFALGMTAYILLAIRWEERDLVRAHGAAYEAYRRRVPKLLPRIRRSASNGTAQRVAS